VRPLQARCQIGQRAGNRRNGYYVAFLDLTATDRSGVEPQVGAVSTALLSGHRHVLHAVVVRYLKLVDPRRGLVAGDGTDHAGADQRGPREHERGRLDPSG